MGDNNKIVLAYSGGLDTTVMIHWLKKKYRAKIIACTVNVGNVEDIKEIEARAYAAGADKFYYIDAAEEYVKDYIFPAVKANAVYERKYLLATALSRPLIAKKIVDVAKMENTKILSHGATGKGNDQVRFEVSFNILYPGCKVIAPWREWELRSRSDEIEYAKKNRLPIKVTVERPYSIDENAGHISYEGGVLEDIERGYPEDLFRLVSLPKMVTNDGETVSVTFSSGIPTKVNGVEYTPLRLINELNKIGGRNGIGIVDIVENRLVGIKSRGVYESPGLFLLHQAHQELESITLDRETMHFKEIISLKYAELVYYGLWYTKLKEACDAFIDKTQERVTGEVKFELYRGTIRVVSRRSPYSLYSRELATFEKEELYDQRDASGFIKLFSLPYILSKEK